MKCNHPNIPTFNKQEKLELKEYETAIIRKCQALDPWNKTYWRTMIYIQDATQCVKCRKHFTWATKEGYNKVLEMVEAATK